MTTRRGFLAWCAGALAALGWPAKADGEPELRSHFARVIESHVIGNGRRLYGTIPCHWDGERGQWVTPMPACLFWAYEVNDVDTPDGAVVLVHQWPGEVPFFIGSVPPAPRVDWSDRNDPNYGRRAQVIDIYTGESVGPCQWADEATGEYRVLLQDERGLFYTVPDRNGWPEVAHAIRRGRIKIIFEA